MSSFTKIYHNTIGISFYWKKKDPSTSTPKIQLVFRDIGFLLTLEELKDFSHACAITTESQVTGCPQCKTANSCRTLLLRTPSSKIDLAVSPDELIHISELINRTIFKVELNDWITMLSFN